MTATLASLAPKQVAQPLTRSRINAVKAAFKAGVRPLVIARQFGVSQQAIRQALSERQE